MVQRVTTTTLTRTLNAEIQANARRLATAQQKIASGKELRRPSDGPSGVLRALDQRAELRRYAQYDRNASDATSWLANADATLMTVVDRVTRVRSLVLEAVNGATDQTGRNAAAAEIEGIREEMLGLANTTYLGRPIFSGVSSTAHAFAADGQYLGDGRAVTRTVAPGTSMQVNVPGDAIFGVHDDDDPALGNLFQVLGQIAEDLRSGSTDDARQGISRIDGAVDRISLTQSQIGAWGRQLEALGVRNGDVTLELQAELAEVEDVDYAHALIEMQSRQFAYQAALSVTAKIIQPSLLDFLR